MTSSKDNKTNNVSQIFKLGEDYIYPIQTKANASDTSQDWIKISNKSPILSDNTILYSSAEIITAMQKSLLSNKQYQTFSQLFEKRCNEYHKISFADLKQIIQEANLSTTQAKIFCLSLETEHKKYQTPSFSKIAKPTLYEILNSNANIFYKFTDSGLDIDGGMYGINIDNLIPRVTYKDGKYTCGATSTTNVSSAIEKEKEKIRQVVLYNFVYEDLLSRKNFGEKLEKPELDFMEKHQQALKKHGLIKDKNGNLKQQNPNTNLFVKLDKTVINPFPLKKER